MYYLAHVVIVMVLQPDRIWKVGIASAAYTSIHDCHHKFMFVMYTYPMNMMSGADSGGGGCGVTTHRSFFQYLQLNMFLK